LAEILVNSGEGNLIPVVATFTSPWNLGKKKWGVKENNSPTIPYTYHRLLNETILF